MSIQDTVTALLDLDDNALDSEKIFKIQKVAPNQEEMNLLNGYKGNVTELSNIEQFLI